MIELRNVGITYTHNFTASKQILSNINLHIRQGEFVCLLGPSGCGKTSLLNLMAGFISPTEGVVYFSGKQVTAPGQERGVVFQEHTLFPWLTAIQNVAFGLRRQRMAKRKALILARQMLETVGLSGCEQSFPHTLSGGMRQRIAIARTLVLDPEALLMDEPFSALDANSRERLQDELLRLWKLHGHTLVYVTHSVEEAVYLADRVIIIGPEPPHIVADMRISQTSPRERYSASRLEQVRKLRACLDSLPCCIGPQ